MKKIFLTLILVSSAIINNFAEDSPFVRYPALNSNGTQIAFSFQGDIWTVASTGGEATRLTIHEAYDGYPYWSGDDSRIAFSSNRYGNYDLFVMPAKGGIPKRLTYHSANDIITDFSGNELLFATSRLFRQVEWDNELGVVNIEGGTPMRLLNAVGNMAVKSPNGKLIAFVRGWGRIQREKYKGSADFEIWIYNIETKKYNRITNNKTHDVFPRWAGNNTLYFLSARNGKYNIYKTTVTSEGKTTNTTEQITDFENLTPRFLNISKDASTLVITRGTDIYTVKTATGKTEKVDIKIASDYRFDPVVQKTYTNEITEYAVSPNGKYSAVVIRGEIFITENNKKKNLTINLTNNPFRDKDVAWINDTTLIFVSDREGEYDLYALSSADKNQGDLFKSLKHKIKKLTDTEEDESNPIISPDGKKIVYKAGRGKLICANIASDGKLSNHEILLKGWAEPEGISWSPDSRWLAYSLSDLYFNDEVYIHPVDNNIKPINVSMHPRGDYSPVWSPDGSKLAFISLRGKTDKDIWFAWLREEDWEKTKEDWEYPDENIQPKKKSKKKKSAKIKPIKIDTENIHNRLVRLTAMPGDEENPVFSRDGKTLYFTAKNITGKGTDLVSIKYDKTQIQPLTKGGQSPQALSPDCEYKNIYLLKKGRLGRFGLKTKKIEMLPVKAKIKIDFVRERKQIFEESWRALRDGFYDPHFHGVDWQAVKEIYEPMCLKASTQKDFQDMYNMMLGEMNASHMGMKYANKRAELQKETTGLLGVELKKEGDELIVVHVIPKSPADRIQSKLKKGDIIKSVNGIEITEDVNIYALLVNTAKEKTLLGIKRNGKEKEIVIRPTADLKKQLYNEWVEQNRKLVDKWSNGKFGYLHIQGMGWENFEKFEREFTAIGTGKDAIIIDVRFNGGGWITDYLMTVLNYKQHAYTIPRGAADNLEKEKKNFREYYPIGERLPYAAWTKPSIALCNQNSYSNAEIFSHAYKNLGIGKLIGVPTFGAVISTGSKKLIDGSTIRMPFRGWFVKADNTDMDFVPAIPNIIVENPPDAKITGNDLQLKRAVEELKKEINNK
jgi:C-terminal processing protease CtpA/Prc/Tol biopolymer transport system component